MAKKPQFLVELAIWPREAKALQRVINEWQHTELAVCNNEEEREAKKRSAVFKHTNAILKDINEAL